MSKQQQAQQQKKKKARNAPLVTYGKRPNKRRRLTFDLNDDDTDMVSSQPIITKHPPASQNEAMAADPDPASIETLVSICAIDPATAARYLRAKANNVQVAMNAIFDNESIEQLESSTTWDESVWQTDRDGNHLHPLGTSIPNTGRNSPAPSLGVTQPKTKADEDREFEAALAASRGSDLPFQQENGIVRQDGTSVTFGPATREQYDANQWALVPTYSAAQEIVPDVPAKERRQQGPEPRLLKHLPDGDYTPNLLTICYAIPKAREAFLMSGSGFVKPDYGHDSDWWKGHSIPTPRIVHTADGSSAQPDSDMYDELIAETQRLMAFLDRSDRIYATIGGITSADIIKNNNLERTKSGSLLELFLQSWTTAAASKVGDTQAAVDQVHSLFNTTVGTHGTAGMVQPDMTVVDLVVKPDQDERKDLFELLDNLLWDTDPDDLDRADNYIERPAEIMVVKVARPTKQLGVEVPAILHLDKYLQENVAATRDVRQEMTQGKARIKKIERVEEKLKNWQHPTKSTQIDARKLLDHTLGHYSGKNHKDADMVDQSNGASLGNHELQHYPDVARQLQEVIASIDKKLSALAEEKERTRKAVSDMSKTNPPGLIGSESKYHYTLRGVATKPNITYILHPKSTEDSQDLVSDEEAIPKGFQWWRLEYETSASNAKLSRTRFDADDVLRAVELEHNSALLVYAIDEAADPDVYPNGDIPQPLQAFVERDNEHFALELTNDQPNPPAYGDTLFDSADHIPRRSIERRDSMDSTNAVRDDGDSPTLGGSLDEFANPAQHHGFGLGYGSKLDPPAVDILLDPEGDDKEIEMVEKHHAPLIPRPAQNGAGTDDIAMGGTESQDNGVGGATHVEDSSILR